MREQEDTEVNETYLWEETNKLLELRERLLELSVQFHKSAKVFSEKMNRGTSAFESLTENEVSSTNRGYELIEQHHKLKKGLFNKFVVFFKILR